MFGSFDGRGMPLAYAAAFMDWVRASNEKRQQSSGIEVKESHDARTILADRPGKSDHPVDGALVVGHGAE
jgi:hypothetical protein